MNSTLLPTKETTRQNPSAHVKTTMCLDEMFLLGACHLNNLVDEEGKTYFNVFLTDPAEAVSDWPDFVDLPARYWEAALMIEEATGQSSIAGARAKKGLFRYFEADGLAYRPECAISDHTPEMFDQSRLLYSLVSAAMSDPADKEIRSRIENLIEGLRDRSTSKDDYAYIQEIGLYFGGTLVRPLVQAGLICDRGDWIDFAGMLIRGILNHSDLLGPKGEFKGHVHGALSFIAGCLAYAILKNDEAIQRRALTGFEYVRSFSTKFGFVPELAQREDDLIACETCTLMDYLDVALLLARHVDASYWDVVEKATRNHLWESQIRDASWLEAKADATDETDIIRTRLRDRMVGAFAGWSAPHCLLAYKEEHGCGWPRVKMKDERKALYLGKVRAVQNCCAGGGVRAVHQVWSNIVERKGDVLNVNLSLDRSTTDVDVISFLPFEGRVVIRIKNGGFLRWRFPAELEPEALVASSNQPGHTPQWKREGCFLNFGRQESGFELTLLFPVALREEAVTIGNKGHQQYTFDVTWAGDTVLAMEPRSTNATTGFTSLLSKTVLAFYGDKGIGPIYQRKDWINTAGLPRPYPVTHDRACRIDWYGL